MKYKVGDKVRVREDLIVGEIYHNCYFIEDMEKYKGKETAITEIRDSYRKKYMVDLTKQWIFGESMLEDVGMSIIDGK